MANRTSLRIRVLPRFPVRISADAGLAVVSDGVDLVVKPDFGALTTVPAINDPNTTFFWGWEQSFDTYLRISFQNLVENIQDVIIGPTTAAMEATSPTTDQIIYFTGPDVAATAALTALGRTLIAAATADQQRAALSNAFYAFLNNLPNKPDGSIAGLAVGDWFISSGYLAKVQP